MSRAAILPYPGDPYLLNYWLKFFRNVWYKEVDKLYIYHNSTIEDEMEKYIAKIAIDPKIRYIYEPQVIEHGEVINRALDYVREDHLMLIEDDAYIFKSGLVDYCFKRLESGDYKIVGSKRGSCSEEISKVARDKWGIQMDGEGDQGCNFWPCYFFVGTNDLKTLTSRNFGANGFNRGDLIKPLDHIVQGESLASDTFVLASLELRSHILENQIYYIPQNHAHPSDIEYAERGVYLFNQGTYWTHVGSLSTGIGGVLRDDQNRPLVRRKIDPPMGETILPNPPKSDMEKREWERRTSFWMNFYENASDNRGSEEFYQLYGSAIDRLINQYRLSIKTVRKFQVIYGTLGL